MLSMKVQRRIYQGVEVTFRIPNEKVNPYPDEADYVHISRRLVAGEKDMVQRAKAIAIRKAAKQWPDLTPRGAGLHGWVQWESGPKRTRFDIGIWVEFITEADAT